ncbi:hypothetical protein Tco_0900744 [Tanacetum coccineum]
MYEYEQMMFSTILKTPLASAMLYLPTITQNFLIQQTIVLCASVNYPERSSSRVKETLQRCHAITAGENDICRESGTSQGSRVIPKYFMEANVVGKQDEAFSVILTNEAE